MKKLFISLVVTVMVCAFAFAGGSSEKGTMDLAASTGGMSASSPAGRGMAKFAELVNQYSEGAIKIKVFYDTTLGNSSSIVSGMMQGTVDFGICGDSYYSGLVPEIQAFELPYMFESQEEARAALNGPAADYLIGKLEPSGIQALAFWEIGFRQLTNNIRPVKNVSDLKGIKIRCLPATFQVKAWEGMGALPVPMDISELYSSLQQKVVDGQENPISEIYNQRFYEVQRYLSLTNHVYTPMLLSCGGQTWARFTPNQQEIILRAAKEAQAEVFRINDEDNAKLLSKIASAGVLVTEDVDVESFKQAVTGSRDLFVQQYGFDILNILE